MGNTDSRPLFPAAYLNIEPSAPHFVAGYHPVSGRVTLRIGGIQAFTSDKLQIMLRGIQFIKYDE